jgi:CCAAT-binding transcription factor (CBF-B/NF-YA) subunit B
MRALIPNTVEVTECDLALLSPAEPAMVVNAKQLAWIQRRRLARQMSWAVVKKEKMLGRSLHAKRRYEKEVSGFTKRKLKCISY